MLTGGRFTEPVLTLMNDTVFRFFLCKVSIGIEKRIIFGAVLIDSQVTHVLTAKRTNHIELLKLFSVLINETGPLLHLISRFFIKLILVEVIFLLKLT